MKYDLTKPCEGCPFKKDATGVRLDKHRIVDIASVTAKGGSFVCHKTTARCDEDDLDEDGNVPFRINHKEQHCAGAFIFALHSGDPLSQLVVEMRTAHLPGHFDKLHANKDLTYANTEEWIKKGSFE
jgi:hypothetical protein